MLRPNPWTAREFPGSDFYGVEGGGKGKGLAWLLLRAAEHGGDSSSDRKPKGERWEDLYKEPCETKSVRLRRENPRIKREEGSEHTVQATKRRGDRRPSFCFASAV